MKIERLEVMTLEIPFKASFKHASADRAKMASVWVKAYVGRNDVTGYGEGCPREYVTGENLQSAIAWINRNHDSIIHDIGCLETLKTWVLKHEKSIDQAPAAWCAVELALLDLLGRNAGQSFETLLSLPALPPVFQYSAVLGDSDPAGFSTQVLKYLSAGFLDFKIKLSGDLQRDLGKIECLNSTGAAVKIRGDANNLWRASSELIDYLDRLGQPFWALEEPLAPRDFAGLSEISRRTGIKIVIDESFTQARDLDVIKDNPDFWILNLRVSKLGGLIRSLDILQHARSIGLKLIIGAHVGETSVLSRAGLTLSSAAGDDRVAMEGAFGTHLLEYDVCEPPLMFGKDGVLRTVEWSFPNTPGSGLDIKELRNTFGR
jgi:L-Ala-D/L-Glu epimerase